MKKQFKYELLTLPVTVSVFVYTVLNIGFSGILETLFTLIAFISILVIYTGIKVARLSYNILRGRK